MTMEYDRLHVVSLDQAAHERTCGYWYTVTNGAMAHTAFATRAGLDRWLQERNLRIEDELPEPGEWGYSRIDGTYRKESHMNPEDFDEIAVSAVRVTAVMDNAQYTLGLITDEGGVCTVHYLNCNVKTRFVFDYQRTRELMS